MHECYASHGGRNLLQQLQPFSADFRLEILKSRDVSAWPAEVGNEATSDGIGCARDNDRDRLGRFLEYPNGRIAPCNDYVRPKRD